MNVAVSLRSIVGLLVSIRYAAFDPSGDIEATLLHPLSDTMLCNVTLYVLDTVHLETLKFSKTSEVFHT